MMNETHRPRSGTNKVTDLLARAAIQAQVAHDLKNHKDRMTVVNRLRHTLNLIQHPKPPGNRWVFALEQACTEPPMHGDPASYGQGEIAINGVFDLTKLNAALFGVSHTDD